MPVHHSPSVPLSLLAVTSATSGAHIPVLSLFFCLSISASPLSAQIHILYEPNSDHSEGVITARTACGLTVGKCVRKPWGKDMTAKGRDQGQPDGPEQGMSQEERDMEGGWGPACQPRGFIYIRTGECMPNQPSAAPDPPCSHREAGLWPQQSP